ncbi:MAG: hypothetical protein P8H38_05275 [Flavobacteriaceae bacterium]|nr:hypothetical protein [Flavobacteriaceae bacterium]
MNKKLVFRYVFEVIVIVFSVSLSFYIQELLNDREKNLLKNEGLNGVLNDLSVDKSQFKMASDVIYYRIKLIEDFFHDHLIALECKRKEIQKRQ